MALLSPLRERALVFKTMGPRARQPRALKRKAKTGGEQDTKQSAVSTKPAKAQSKARSRVTKRPQKKQTVPQATHTDNVDDADPDLDGGVPLPASSATGLASTKQRALSNHEVPATSGSKSIPCIRSDEPGSARPPDLIFTHGAGGGLSAPALVNFAQGFANAGSKIVCFQGNMNLKSRTKMFSTVLDYEKQKNETSKSKVAFGGRSMGSRAAVLAAQEDKDVQMLILVSYPLTGPNGDVRDQILLDIDPGVDVLFISGDRDSMCDVKKLEHVRGKMEARSWMAVVQGADHGMNVKGGKKRTETIGHETGKLAAGWIAQRDATMTEMSVSWDNGTESVVGSGIWVQRGGQEIGQSQEEPRGRQEGGGKKGVKRRRNE